MTISADKLRVLLASPEDEHLEFKRAESSYSEDKVVKYCCALANEGGGKLLLGIADAKPRQIIGSQAFPDLEKIRATLVRELRLKIPVYDLRLPEGRVVVFEAPPHPLGLPLQYERTYWCRRGEELTGMTPHQLQQILDETGPDFSASFCPASTPADLDTQAVQLFREKWAEKSKEAKRLTQPLPNLLEDAELLDGDQLTYAALILLGTHKSLNRLLGQSEIVFEYRSNERPGPAQERHEFRQAAILFLDPVWELVNKRNDLQSWQDGLYMKQIATFDEGAIREAVLNAVAHRDYRLAGSVFVRQYPQRIRIESPGGFLPGITPETILFKQAPRNRRLAESLARCGLVERSGQGYDRILESCIRGAKPRPRFEGTDNYQVFLTLDGQVQDTRFLRLLESIGQERMQSFDTDHLVLLDLAYRQQPIPTALHPFLPQLMDAGILEKVGRKIIPSRRLMGLLGEAGKYTRLKGLDRPAQRALLLQHIQESKGGAKFEDLHQVLPGIPERTVKDLLQSMKAKGLIHTQGKTKAARWMPGPASNPRSDRA